MSISLDFSSMNAMSSLFMSKLTSFQSLKSYRITEKVVNKSYDSARSKFITFVLSLAPGALMFFNYSSGKPYSNNLLQLSSNDGS